MGRPRIASRRALRLSLAGIAVAVAALAALSWTGTLELTAGSAGLAAAVAALAVAVSAHAGAAARAEHELKVSEELDALSAGLIRVEAMLAAMEGSDSRDTSDITDIAGDMSGLSAVVASLAESVSTHERVLTAIGERAAAGLSYRAALDRIGSAARLPERQDADSVVPSLFPLAPERPGAAPFAAPAADPRPGPSARDAAILAAVEAGQIDLHVQPIVTLPQRRERAHEVYALLRLSDTEVLVPEEYGPSVERLGRSPDLDLLVLERALAFAGRIAASGSDAVTICRLSAGTLAGPERLRPLVDRHPSDAGRMHLEIAFETWRGLATPAREALADLATAGVRFCLDQVPESGLDAADLARSAVRLAKIPAARLLGADALGAGDPRVLEAVIALGQNGIQLVATRVEDERVVPELLELGIGLAQGFAFAFPSPAHLVAPDPTAPRLTADRGTALAPPTAAPDKRSLRSFLRRA